MLGNIPNIGKRINKTIVAKALKADQFMRNGDADFYKELVEKHFVADFSYYIDDLVLSEKLVGQIIPLYRKIFSFNDEELTKEFLSNEFDLASKLKLEIDSSMEDIIPSLFDMNQLKDIIFTCQYDNSRYQLLRNLDRYHQIIFEKPLSNYEKFILKTIQRLQIVGIPTQYITWLYQKENLNQTKESFLELIDLTSSPSSKITQIHLLISTEDFEDLTLDRFLDIAASLKEKGIEIIYLPWLSDQNLQDVIAGSNNKNIGMLYLDHAPDINIIRLGEKIEHIRQEIQKNAVSKKELTANIEFDNDVKVDLTNVDSWNRNHFESFLSYYFYQEIIQPNLNKVIILDWTEEDFDKMYKKYIFEKYLETLAESFQNIYLSPTLLNKIKKLDQEFLSRNFSSNLNDYPYIINKEKELALGANATKLGPTYGARIDELVLKFDELERQYDEKINDQLTKTSILASNNYGVIKIKFGEALHGLSAAVSQAGSAAVEGVGNIAVNLLSANTGIRTMLGGTTNINKMVAPFIKIPATVLGAKVTSNQCDEYILIRPFYPSQFSLEETNVGDENTLLGELSKALLEKPYINSIIDLTDVSKISFSQAEISLLIHQLIVFKVNTIYLRSDLEGIEEIEESFCRYPIKIIRKEVLSHENREEMLLNQIIGLNLTVDHLKKQEKNDLEQQQKATKSPKSQVQDPVSYEQENEQEEEEEKEEEQEKEKEKEKEEEVERSTSEVRTHFTYHFCFYDRTGVADSIKRVRASTYPFGKLTGSEINIDPLLYRFFRNRYIFRSPLYTTIIGGHLKFTEQYTDIAVVRREKIKMTSSIQQYKAFGVDFTKKTKHAPYSREGFDRYYDIQAVPHRENLEKESEGIEDDLMNVKVLLISNNFYQFNKELFFLEKIFSGVNTLTGVMNVVKEQNFPRIMLSKLTKSLERYKQYPQQADITCLIRILNQAFQLEQDIKITSFNISVFFYLLMLDEKNKFNLVNLMKDEKICFTGDSYNFVGALMSIYQTKVIVHENIFEFCYKLSRKDNILQLLRDHINLSNLSGQTPKDNFIFTVDMLIADMLIADMLNKKDDRRHTAKLAGDDVDFGNYIRNKFLKYDEFNTVPMKYSNDADIFDYFFDINKFIELTLSYSTSKAVWQAECKHKQHINTQPVQKSDFDNFVEYLEANFPNHKESINKITPYLNTCFNSENPSIPFGIMELIFQSNTQDQLELIALQDFLKFYNKQILTLLESKGISIDDDILIYKINKLISVKELDNIDKIRKEIQNLQCILNLQTQDSINFLFEQIHSLEMNIDQVLSYAQSTQYLDQNKIRMINNLFIEKELSVEEVLSFYENANGAVSVLDFSLIHCVISNYLKDNNEDIITCLNNLWIINDSNNTLYEKIKIDCSANQFLGDKIKYFFMRVMCEEIQSQSESLTGLLSDSRQYIDPYLHGYYQKVSEAFDTMNPQLTVIDIWNLTFLFDEKIKAEKDFTSFGLVLAEDAKQQDRIFESINDINESDRDIGALGLTTIEKNLLKDLRAYFEQYVRTDYFKTATTADIRSAIHENKKRFLEAKENTKEFYKVYVETCGLISYFVMKNPAFGFAPKKTQILSLLTKLFNTRQVQQIATGEGKTLIMAMHAMMEYVQGRQVEYFTSADNIAQQSYEKMKPILELLGVSCDRVLSINDPLPNVSILISNIDNRILNSLINEEDVKGLKDKAILLDEADFPLLDIPTDYKIPQNIKGLKDIANLKGLYEIIDEYEFLENDNYIHQLIREFRRPENIQKLFNLDYLPTRKIQLREYINKIKSIPQTIIDDFVKAKKAVVNLIEQGEGQSFQHIQRYEKGKIIYYARPLIAGMVQEKSNFSLHVQQLLHIYLEKQYPNRRYFFPEPKDIKSFHTVDTFLRYAMMHGCFLGVTGTAGSSQEREKLAKRYPGLGFVDFPRYKKSALNKYIFTESDLSLSNVEQVKIVTQSFRDNEQPSYLITGNDTKRSTYWFNQLHNLYPEAPIQLYDARGRSENGMYFESHDDLQFVKMRKMAATPGTITIATVGLGGRGVDITVLDEDGSKTENGLGVVVAGKLTERMMMQAIGRTARNGGKGCAATVDDSYVEPILGDDSYNVILKRVIRDTYQFLIDEVEEGNLDKNKFRKLWSSFSKDLLKDGLSIKKSLEYKSNHPKQESIFQRIITEGSKLISKKIGRKVQSSQLKEKDALLKEFDTRVSNRRNILIKDVYPEVEYKDPVQLNSLNTGEILKEFKDITHNVNTPVKLYEHIILISEKYYEFLTQDQIEALKNCENVYLQVISDKNITCNTDQIINLCAYSLSVHVLANDLNPYLPLYEKIKIQSNESSCQLHHWRLNSFMSMYNKINNYFKSGINFSNFSIPTTLGETIAIPHTLHSINKDKGFLLLHAFVQSLIANEYKLYQEIKVEKIEGNASNNPLGADEFATSNDSKDEENDLFEDYTKAEENDPFSDKFENASMAKKISIWEKYLETKSFDTSSLMKFKKVVEKGMSIHQHMFNEELKIQKDFKYLLKCVADEKLPCFDFSKLQDVLDYCEDHPAFAAKEFFEYQSQPFEKCKKDWVTGLKNNQYYAQNPSIHDLEKLGFNFNNSYKDLKKHAQLKLASSTSQLIDVINWMFHIKIDNPKFASLQLDVDELVNDTQNLMNKINLLDFANKNESLRKAQIKLIMEDIFYILEQLVKALKKNYLTAKPKEFKEKIKNFLIFSLDRLFNFSKEYIKKALDIGVKILIEILAIRNYLKYFISKLYKNYFDKKNLTKEDLDKTIQKSKEIVNEQQKDPAAPQTLFDKAKERLFAAANNTETCEEFFQKGLTTPNLNS